MSDFRPSRLTIPFDQSPLSDPLLGVVEFFDHRLAKKWEIYARPLFNGLRPDVVLLNPEVGIALFVVGEIRSTISPAFENLVSKAHRCKEALLNLYCPRLARRVADDPKLASLITAGVIVADESTARARAHLIDTLTRLDLNTDIKRHYYPVSGYDDMTSGNLGVVFPEGTRARSKFMTETFALDIRTWLIESEHSRVQRNSLELDKKQREIATSRNESGFRRIRGPAGAGKSQVLAARASQLSSEGKDVLVVSFNITLWHYLRDLSMRFPNPHRRIADRVVWTHFHQWCRDVCAEAGLSSGTEDDSGQDDTDLYFAQKLPKMAEKAIARIGPKYDAILVDEGQDFFPDWWRILRMALRPNGEMMLTADKTQDLYGRANRWTDEVMKGAGFHGPWTELDVSYRLPPTLTPLLRQYAEAFLPSDAAPPTLPQKELNLWPVQTRWVQTPPGSDLGTIAAEYVLDHPRHTDPTLMNFADVILLTQTHETGERCVDALNANGVAVAHIFSEDKGVQRKRKIAFYMRDERIKATTIKSFKGWEARALVIVIDRADDVSELAEIYVALSRVKRHMEGSFLTVLCAAPKLAEFGKSWSHLANVNELVLLTPQGV